MKKITLLLLWGFLIQSCIPIRIAPSIEDYQVTEGKKFKRELPKRQMFIFEDPKEENAFYNYVNVKFQLEDDQVYDDVPFSINGAQYFLSSYETEIPDKAINLFPALLDATVNGALNVEDNDPLEATEIIRNGNWYIAMEVYSDSENDCLKPNSLSRNVVLKYLRDLKNEYLATHNYNEFVLKN